MASGAGSFHLLTQLMSSHGPHFLLAISAILRSKNILLVFFTVLQKNFQSSNLFESLYLSRSLLQLSFHQLLECFVMLTNFMFLFHTLSTLLVKLLTAFSSMGILERFEMSSFFIALIISLTKISSSLLSFLMDFLCILMNSSDIGIIIDRGAWSDERCHSE